MKYHNILKIIFLKGFFKKNTEGGLWTISHCLLIVALATVISCSNEQAEAPNITRDQLGIEKGKEVEIIYSDSARVKVRVTGPTMLYYTGRDEPKQVFPDGTVTYFYDEFQQEMSVLTGKYAIRDEKNRRVIIRDSVVWESKTDGRLETSELIWDEATNIIRSTKFTRITREKDRISGFNFETDDKLTHWRILAPRGNFNVGNLQQQMQ